MSDDTYIIYMKKINVYDEKGIWTYIQELDHPEGKYPKIKLIPMIHIGEEEYFHAMKLELASCDVALYEGAFLNTRGILTTFYRLLASAKRMRLAVQGDRGNNPSFAGDESEKSDIVQEGSDGPQTFVWKTIPYSDFPKFVREVKYIRADLGLKGTERALSSVPKWFWSLSAFFALGAGLLAWPFIDRKTLVASGSSGKAEVDTDFTSAIDELGLPEFLAGHARTFAHYVEHARDEYLQQVLAGEIRKYAKSKHVIGVQYGAAHIVTLRSWLIKEFGYKACDGKYMLVAAAEIGSEKEYLEKQLNRSSAAYFERMEELYFRAFPDGPEDAEFEADLDLQPFDKVATFRACSEDRKRRDRTKGQKPYAYEFAD